jgi:Glycosyl transferase family 2
MEHPLVFVAILAKQKEKMLPAWLDSLKHWDYPKDRMILYVRSNNNTDNTESILREWVEANRKWYRLVIEEYEDIEVPVQEYGVHEWNPVRFKALGEIRNRSIELAYLTHADYYWVVDVDNFVMPHTLSTMVGINLPVVAPLVRYAMGSKAHEMYANYHLLANVRGYYLDDIRYYQVLRQEIKGLIVCDVVHCTYLIRRDVFEDINYLDGTDDYEYVIFSRNLREAGIPQYLDNREVYGYLSLNEDVDAIVRAMKTL